MHTTFTCINVHIHIVQTINLEIKAKARVLESNIFSIPIHPDTKIIRQLLDYKHFYFITIMEFFLNSELEIPLFYKKVCNLTFQKYIHFINIFYMAET